MTGRRLQTVVADTSALVSLAVPRAVGATEDDAVDVLQRLLTSCELTVPPEVVTELRELRQYQDIHAAAAANVLTARDHYTVTTPYQYDRTPESRPAFGLDSGETDGVVLANAVDADGFLTDEFGGNSFPVIHASLRSSQLVPTPQLLRDYARNGHLAGEEARATMDVIGSHRSWDNSPYVTRIRTQLTE